MGERTVWRGLALAAALAASGCATPTPPEGALVPDPYEPLNRDIHEFNVGLDLVLLRPASQAYDAATPALVKHLLRNVVNHVRLVPIFVNYTLQGDADGMGETFGRFVANTFLGGAGLLDPATDIGLPLRPTDFGITLAEWGVGEGPFLMLPFFGPSTGRDAVGTAVDTVAFSPWTYVGVGSGSGEIAFTVGRVAVPAVDQRAANGEIIDEVLYGSGDSYVTLRSFYIQNRRQAVVGDEVNVDALPDIFAED